MLSVAKKTVPIGYNGNQLAEIENNADKFSLKMDFLIINLLVHNPQQFDLMIQNNKTSNFSFIKQEFGTKIFNNRYEVYLQNELIGTYLSDPRSKNILKADFSQFQFENHLFYTLHLKQLKQLTENLCSVLGAEFKSVNRLDVALDLENTNDFYQNVTQSILNNQLLVSGKDKKINTYYQTQQGKPQLTGFTIGSRSNSRYLRVYNKALELTKKPKEYILNSWSNANLEHSKVWRFEYQLNNSFFRFLHKKTNYTIKNDTATTELLTWGIFDERTLFSLLERATKNHFEIKYNTGKSEVNKEPSFVLLNFDYLKSKLGQFTAELIKIKKAIEPSLLSVKRMLKSTFREYYSSNQTSISHILSLNESLLNYSNDLFDLNYWFHSKIEFYLAEFKTKQKKNIQFDYSLFDEHLQYSI